MEVKLVQLHVSTRYIGHLQVYYGDFVFVYLTYIVTVCDMVCVLGCFSCLTVHFSRFLLYRLVFPYVCDLLVSVFLGCCADQEN
jgi:hypothetical protein